MWTLLLAFLLFSSLSLFLSLFSPLRQANPANDAVSKVTMSSSSFFFSMGKGGKGDPAAPPSSVGLERERVSGCVSIARRRRRREWNWREERGLFPLPIMYTFRRPTRTLCGNAVPKRQDSIWMHFYIHRA